MRQKEFSIAGVTKDEIVGSLMIQLDIGIIENRDIPIEKAITPKHVKKVGEKMIDILMHDTPVVEEFWNLFGEILDNAVFETIYEEFNK